jgi:enoyl-CoA hydratase/carnithine racemase
MLRGPAGHGRNAADADAQEGIAAFLEKRPPQWPR